MTNTIKGFKDYTGKEAEKRAVIIEILKSVFQRYGFEPAETPVIESEEFVRGDNKQDEAVSDIYKLKDKGKRKLALRYEFTFQLKRLMKNKKLPYKRFQIGPVFRDEPVKENRLRQFTQCDVDVIGGSIKQEAEILALTKDILNKLKVDAVTYVNNRQLLNEILESEGINKNKEQIIRELDKLDKLPEKEVRLNLKKYRADKILNIFKKPESYFKKYQSYSKIEELKKYCKYYGVRIVFSPSLARGLSYYGGNVFEIKTKKNRDTICAGGSYKFNNIQSTGITFGLERLSVVTNMLVELEKYLVVSLEQDAKAVRIAQQLRNKGKNVSVFYGKPSKALEYANAYGIKKVIFVGGREVKLRKFKIKNMKTGRETILRV